MGDAAHPPGASTAPKVVAPAELVEEARLGGTPTGRAVNAALLALSRTARSFTLYDARNQAVREFLRDLKAKLAKALEAVGKPLELDVRSFELVLAGEVVYVERDRERSLAFRLFRDGVRKLTLRPGLVWDEILGLVEILSVRYTGVRQQEDDLVTLLSKAAFEHIGFVAIEGFAPEEEIQEQGAPAGATAHVEPPPDWDLPAPDLGEPLELNLAFRPLSDGALQGLRAEHDDDSPARECVDLALDLLDCVADARDSMEERHVDALVFDVRDFLLSEGRFQELFELLTALERDAPRAVSKSSSILARFGGPDALRRLAHWQQEREAPPPPDVFRYLKRVPGEHLAQTLDLLEAAADDRQRTAFKSLVAGLAVDDPQAVSERMDRVDAVTASDLLQALTAAVPAQAGTVALKLLERPEPSLQVLALDALSGLADAPPAARTVLQLLGSAGADVRGAALRYLAAHRDPRAHDVLVEYARAHAGDLADDEAEALGEALAVQDAAASLAMFGDWLHPRTLLRRVVESPAQRLLHRAAVAGLVRIPGDDAEKLLRWFLGKSSGDLHQLCLAALVQRRRAQRAPGGGPHAG